MDSWPLTLLLAIPLALASLVFAVLIGIAFLFTAPFGRTKWLSSLFAD